MPIDLVIEDRDSTAPMPTKSMHDADRCDHVSYLLSVVRRLSSVGGQSPPPPRTTPTFFAVVGRNPAGIFFLENLH